MATQIYGTLDPSILKRVKVNVTSQLGNGTSSVQSIGTVTAELDCLYADIATYIPAQFSSCPISGFSNYQLINAVAEQRDLATAVIKLTWQSYTGVPSSQYTEQTGYTEEDIQNHPDFDTWDGSGWVVRDDNGLFAGFTDESGMAGITFFVIGTLTVIKKEYFTSKPSAGYSTIGQTSSPGSDYDGSGNWLILGATRGAEGFFWTMTTTYKYSAVEFNTNVYSAA